MTNYSDLYNKKLGYFQQYLDTIVDDLSKKRSVCLCAAYKLGDRRFIDYLAFTLAKSDDFFVFHDEKNEFTVDTLISIQATIAVKKKVLLLPYFEEKDTQFLAYYSKLMRNRSNTFLSVIRVNAEFLDKPEAYFPDTNLPMESLCVMTPFTAIESDEIIAVREALDEMSIDAASKKFIVVQNGGHAGLIKRACSLYRQNGKITEEMMLHDPPTKAVLLQLEHQMRTLSAYSLKRIGLLSQLERCTIPILDKFMANTRGNIEAALSAVETELLHLLQRQQGIPLSLESIHKAIRPNTPYSMWATYKIVSRFTSAIAVLYRVKNVKGKGYLLLEK
jgi:hypothetical protein